MGDLDKERLQCNEGKIWVRRVERVGEEREKEWSIQVLRIQSFMACSGYDSRLNFFLSLFVGLKA